MLKLSVTEYAPKKIKLSLTGKGYSSKEQVAAMVKQLLSLKRLPQTLDASDALAIAITHGMQNKLTIKGDSQPIKAKKNSKGGDWSSFIKNNPDRLG
jgi:crossover junction endodeoxyribonuclease RuvC